MTERLLPFVIVAALLTACSGGPPRAPGSGARAEETPLAEAASPAPSPPPARSALELPDPPGVPQEFGPGLLLPSEAPEDAEVVRVEGRSIRKSHVYERLVESSPQEARRFVDRLVFDVLLAKQAKVHRISVDPKLVQKLVAAREDLLRREARRHMTFETFLDAQFGVTLEQWRGLESRRFARNLLRHYIIRYLALREDRVQVRICWHHDRKVIDRVRAQALEGADFATLALQDSEHNSQSAGGLLPPFGRSSKAVYSAAAFELEPGEVSAVLQATPRPGVTYHFVLSCVKRMPGRDVPFADVRSELELDWRKHPLTEQETNDLYYRLRSASESALNNARKNG